ISARKSSRSVSLSIVMSFLFHRKLARAPPGLVSLCLLRLSRLYFLCLSGSSLFIESLQQKCLSFASAICRAGAGDKCRRPFRHLRLCNNFLHQRFIHCFPCPRRSHCCSQT